MIITIINNYLWEFLWIIIFITSIIGYGYFRQLHFKKVILNKKEKENKNQLFFVSMAGSIGLGNIFVVIDGVQKYGPSIIIWLWVGALLGRYLKFWEIFLSLKYKKNFDDFTGPIVYIKSFNNTLSWVFGFISIFYYMEVFQFNVLIDLIGNGAMKIMGPINYINYIVGVSLLILIYFYRKRDAFISSSSFLMKIFLGGYFSFLIFLGVKYYYYWGKIIQDIFFDLINFKNISRKLLTIGIGIRTAIYCNDIGVGYEGIMQKYANVEPDEQKQIDYAYGIITSNIIDVMVCTTSGLITLFYLKINNIIPGSLSSSQLIVDIFKLMMPYRGYFVLTFLIFCAGFTTLCTLFQSGSLVMQYFKPHWPHYSFYALASPIFLLSLSFNLETLFNLITLGGGLLVLINCIVIYYHLKYHKYT
jgi:Na+/alanine symporter